MAAALLDEMLTKSPTSVVSPDTQALAATIFGFLFAIRAVSICAIQLSDCSVEDGYFRYHQRVDKSIGPQKTRIMSIPVTICDPVRALVRFFQLLSSHPDVPPLIRSSPLVSHWRQRSDSATISNIIKHVAVLLKQSNATSESPDLRAASHALRRGAGVSIHALQVPAQRRLYWGNWSSETSMATYLTDRQFIPVTEAIRTCFNFLLAQYPEPSTTGPEPPSRRPTRSAKMQRKPSGKQ